MNSKIDELKEKHKDDWVGDSIHHWNTVRAIHIETFNKILEELRPYVELGELIAEEDKFLADDNISDIEKGMYINENLTKYNNLIQQIRSKQ